MIFTRTLTALGCALISTTVMAADLPSRKAPPPYIPPPPVFTWTGLYVGLQAGIAWDQVSNNGNYGGWGIAAAPLFPVATTALWAGGQNGANNKTGFVGGGHIGGLYQMGSFVLGLEVDLEVSSLWTGSLRGSVRGRLGFAIDRTLIYATGGMAFASRSGSSTYGWYGYNWGGNTSSSRVGWTVGGGVEYAFTPNWSVGLEYRYTDFGTNNNTGTWGGSLGSNVRLTENAVRARASYHFFSAPAAPVVARY